MFALYFNTKPNNMLAQISCSFVVFSPFLPLPVDAKSQVKITVKVKHGQFNLFSFHQNHSVCFGNIIFLLI